MRHFEQEQLVQLQLLGRSLAARIIVAQDFDGLAGRSTTALDSDQTEVGLLGFSRPLQPDDYGHVSSYYPALPE